MRTVEGACRADCTESFMSSIDPGVMWLGGETQKKGVRHQRGSTLGEYALGRSEIVLINMRDQGGAGHVGQGAEHAVSEMTHKPEEKRKR